MIIGLVLATVFASALGERTGLPWSALLTIVVAPVLFIPGIETVSLDTQLILPIFIPPLLWSPARRTSWAMIRAQVHVVLVKSVVLVFLTIAALTATAMWLMPGYRTRCGDGIGRSDCAAGPGGGGRGGGPGRHSETHHGHAAD